MQEFLYLYEFLESGILKGLTITQIELRRLKLVIIHETFNRFLYIEWYFFFISDDTDEDGVFQDSLDNGDTEQQALVLLKKLQDLKVPYFSHIRAPGLVR